MVQAHGTLSEVLLAENHPNEFALDSAVAANHVDPARPRAPGNRHEFGDTRFRLIAYRVRAATRFREYLPPALYADPQKVTRLGPVAEGVALQVGADPARLRQRPRHGRGRHAGRLGGDEFAVAVPLPLSETHVLAEHIRNRVQALNHDIPGVRCSVSIGLAEPSSPDIDLRGWMEDADRALYRAKAAGRNLAHAAEQPVEFVEP